MAKKLFFLFILTFAGANLLYPQAQDAAATEFGAITNDYLNPGKFAEATPLLEELVKKYPSSPLIDSINFNLGLAYLFNQKFPKALEIFTKLSDPHVVIELREGALFFGALAKTYDSFGKQGLERDKGIEAAIKLFGDFLQNKDFEKSLYREEALFQRTKLFLILEKFEEVQKGVDQLFKEFPTSANRPDYYLTSGQSYSLQAFRMIQDKKQSKDDATPTAQKAFDAFGKIKIADSAVVANDAFFRAAELKNLLADNEEEYRALIPAYRLVKPKNELVPVQDALVEGIKKEKQAAALARNNALIRQLDLRLNKERDRLEQLKEQFDPAVQSLVQVGKVYVRLKQGNEARVILRRAKAFCKEDQRKEISYFVILSYAMQGLIDRADQAFVDYQHEFPNDPQADNISVLIAEELFKQKNYEVAFTQYQKSIKDYPKGRFVELAVMKSAASKVQLKKTEEGIKILQDFVATKKESPYFVEAQTTLAQAYTDLKQPEEALKNYQAIVANPNAASVHPESQYKVAETLNTLKRYDEAIAAWKTLREKFPSHKLAPQSLLMMANASVQKGDLPTAMSIYDQVVKEYASNPDIATSALLTMANIYQKQQKTTEMLDTLNKVIKDYPDHSRVNDAASKLAGYYQQQSQFEKAEEYYQLIVSKKNPAWVASAEYNQGVMYYKAATSLGLYTALNDEEKAKWTARMKKSEEAQTLVLKNFPDSPQVAFALQEILRQTVTKTDAGLLTVDQAQAYFKDLSGQFGSNPALQGRILLVAAGIPFEKGNPTQALQSYEEILKQYPDVVFAAEDMNRYGSSLLSTKAYPKALEVFKKIAETFPKDDRAQADALYGQGASLLFQNQVEEAGKFFEELKKKAPGSPRIIEAELGIGLAAEFSAKTDAALTSYKSVIMNPKATPDLKAKATLGRARIFEMTGMFLPDPTKQALPAASTEYDRVASLYPAEKEAASEALYRLGVLYSKNGKPEEAKQAFQKCIDKYKGSQWAAQAQEKLH
ncbi:MAG: tetratricopeptide repeat protein [Verrucomicrobiota bacterium]